MFYNLVFSLLEMGGLYGLSRQSLVGYYFKFFLNGIDLSLGPTSISRKEIRYNICFHFRGVRQYRGVNNKVNSSGVILSFSFTYIQSNLSGAYLFFLKKTIVLDGVVFICSSKSIFISPLNANKGGEGSPPLTACLVYRTRQSEMIRTYIRS